MNNREKYGQYFTPNYLVKKMLKNIDYTNQNKSKILKKHILDNSCGDGAFLSEIVKIYIKTSLKNKYKTNEIIKDLETYIHGIEIDKNIYNQCLQNLNTLVCELLQEDVMVNWSIYNCDFFDSIFIDNIKFFDYIVGNPPYMRVSTLNNYNKYLSKLTYIKSPMSDLAYVFTEKSLELLNDNGILCYLIPTTFNVNKSIINFRKYIVDTNLLKSFCKIYDETLFDAQTYVGFYIFDKNKDKNDVSIKYNEEINNEIKSIKTYVLKYDDIYINNNFFFAQLEILKCVKSILENKNNIIIAKNGLVTTKDSFFINDIYDFGPYFINICKGSYFNKNKDVWKKCFYPYDLNGEIIPYDKLVQNPSIKAFLEANKDTLSTRPDVLKNGSNERFYGFGKTQAIGDTYKNKIIFSKITNGTLKGIISPKGTHCLNHIYIINNSDLKFDDIVQKLSLTLSGIFDLDSKTEQYIEYDKLKIKLSDIINVICRTQANGYYHIESKTIEKILNYILTIKGEE